MNVEQQYREAAALGANQIQLVVRLYEKIIDDLRRVSDAIEQNDVTRRTDRIKHSILIVGHLESSLDFEKGGRVAGDLQMFYKNLRGRLLDLQFHPAEHSTQQLITDLLALRKAWIQVEQAEFPTTAPTPAHDAPSAVGFGASGESGPARLDFCG